MAVNVTIIRAPIDRVFAVLSDPQSYAHWVVGSDSIRDADASWPAVGTKLHHRVGAGPFKLNDNTEVLEVNPPMRLVLQARTRPFGTARVTLDLLDLGDRTRVTMEEGPGDRLSRLLFNPIANVVLRRRNDVALKRLEELALERAAAPATAAR